MSEQYIAEIRAFGFNFAPISWATCTGQVIAISQNSTLFTIIGTTYGGNGTTTFALPNLQDRVPVGMGTGLGLRNWPLGATFGEVVHTLLLPETPLHNHTVAGKNAAVGLRTAAPGSTSFISESNHGKAYATTASTTLALATIGQTGGTQPHENIQPTQVLNYCIALFGIFPSQN